MATDGRPEPGGLSMRMAGRIAEAFELQVGGVVEDAELLNHWHAGEQALVEYLQDRHAWDASMAPVYLLWLRGTGDSPAS